ncbi:MAG: histidine phosphatase family protein, partial [Clostridiales bacterium]
TDQPLCPQGRDQALALAATGVFAPVDCLYSSPYCRCRETAALLFADLVPLIIPELREFDFGDFEGYTASELQGCPAYQSWVDSFCNEPCPGGESNEQFKERCCLAFARLAQETKEQQVVALVIHGGAIMAIMEKYAYPPKDFYAYHVANCGYFICDLAFVDQKPRLQIIGGSLC